MEKQQPSIIGFVANVPFGTPTSPIPSIEPVPITPTDIPSLTGDISGTPQKLGFSFGGADPLTAGFNAVASFFNFLCTVQGQRVCNDILTLDEEFVKKVHELFVKIHDFIEKKV